MVQSLVKQKIAIAAYGAHKSIPVLTASQFDIAAKIINILTPIEQITRNISTETALIWQAISNIRALAKVLEEVEDTSIRAINNKLLCSLRSKFDDAEDQEFLVLAMLLDPRYKDRFFSSK